MYRFLRHVKHYPINLYLNGTEGHLDEEGRTGAEVRKSGDWYKDMYDVYS